MQQQSMLQQQCAQERQQCMQQQCMPQQEIQSQTRNPRRSHGSAAAQQGNETPLVAELREESQGSVFLKALLEEASLAKEDERLTQQLEDRRGGNHNRRKPVDAQARARME